MHSSSLSASSLTKKIVAAISICLQNRKKPVPLHAPHFRGNEWKYVKECIDTGWVSSVGQFVDRFEGELCKITGAKRAIATVNGTAALHAALVLLDVKEGDEVLVPTLTFVATANAVAYTGATPHFVDSENISFGVDAVKLRSYLKKISTRKKGVLINENTGCAIKALIAVHVFGFPCDLNAVSAVCRDFGITLIEDAAESLGSYYLGRHTGNWGKLSVLSFNGNKTVTTGGGGAILTNDNRLADRAKHLTTTAKVAHAYLFNHDQVGFNYRMPNINAALGVAQLEQLPAFVREKRNLAKRYQLAFQKIEGISFVTEPAYAKSNYWLGCLRIDPRSGLNRDKLLVELNAQGFGARPAWTLMHRLPMYKHCPRMDLSTAIDLEQSLINIPSGVEI